MSTDSTRMTSPMIILAWKSEGRRFDGGVEPCAVCCASRTAAKYRNTTAETCYEAGLAGGLPC